MLRLSKQTTSSAPLLSWLQSTTNEIHLSPSPVCHHGKESSSSFMIMKLLYDLAICEMIHICVRVDMATALSIENLSRPTKDPLDWGILLVDLLSLALDTSAKPFIVLVVSLRELPFFFFPPEWTGLASCFSARLLLCLSTDVGSSSTSSASTFTCTPVDRNEASSFCSLSLFWAGWAEEICRKPMAMLALKSCPNNL